FVVASLITGCSKDKTRLEISKTLYPVIFNVSTFASDITPMGVHKTSSNLPKHADLLSSSAKEGISSTSFENEVRYLSYYIMNEAGKIVLERSIDRENLSDQSKFGRIESSLPAGNYSIIITGQNG